MVEALVPSDYRFDPFYQIVVRCVTTIEDHLRERKFTHYPLLMNSMDTVDTLLFPIDLGRSKTEHLHICFIVIQISLKYLQPFITSADHNTDQIGLQLFPPCIGRIDIDL
jgi:hypothetical protein